VGERLDDLPVVFWSVVSLVVAGAVYAAAGWYAYVNEMLPGFAVLLLWTAGFVALTLMA
jgi:hypothetical protein